MIPVQHIAGPVRHAVESPMWGILLVPSARGWSRAPWRHSVSTDRVMIAVHHRQGGVLALTCHPTRPCGQGRLSARSVDSPQTGLAGGAGLAGIALSVHEA